MKWILLLVLCVFISGCASTNSDSTTAPAADNNNNNDKVSDIPWNRPQSWEGQGQLGGMVNH